ncbi:MULTISPECIES: hypothetical protein [unclassified Nostoc]|uniref:hypothetical protein n=1 Tax=unclassified Nostoc TaxID=2593658 RepID=UPI0025E82620|nr:MULTISPECIES: hypothetical protein [unclassified Nostoc]
MASNNSVRRTQSQVLAKAIAVIGRKYQHHVYAAGTATIIVMQSMPSYGWGLFDSAQTAMTCMFGGAGGIGGAGGAAAATAAIKALPAVINATITVLLFVYFVASGLKVANGIGEGQEVTQMVQQPVGVFFIILVLWIAQSILFNGVTAAC